MSSVTDAPSTLQGVRAKLTPKSPPKLARDDLWLEVIIVVVAAGLAGFSLREYIAPDYLVEILPSIQKMNDGDLRGALGTLPGYPAIALLLLIPAKIATIFGADDANTWRFLSAIGISSIAIAAITALPFLRATEVPRWGARVGVALAVGSPCAYWALRIGHPEELLATGLLLGSVIAAARERPIIAGILLGLACGKAWPAVAALPVMGLLLPDWRRVFLGATSAAVALAAFYVPSIIYASNSVSALTDLGLHTIFNVGHVFWWFGTPIPDSVVATQTVPQPRVGPIWPGELSHPLILGVGTAVGGVWCWSLFQRVGRSRAVSVLRADGRTRSNAEVAQLASAALLVMAGILYARCYLDTWNVPYYLLPGLVLGAMGEILSGRRPIITLVATGIMWKWCTPGDLTVRSDPDVYTAMYLAWTIPTSITLVFLGYKAIHKAADIAEAEAGVAGLDPGAESDDAASTKPDASPTGDEPSASPQAT